MFLLRMCTEVINRGVEEGDGPSSLAGNFQSANSRLSYWLERSAGGHAGERARGRDGKNVRDEVCARSAQAQSKAPPSTRDSLCSHWIDSFSSARASGIHTSLSHP